MNDEECARHIRELENIDDGIEELFDEMAPSEFTEDVEAHGESPREIAARVQRSFAKAQMNYVKKTEGNSAADLVLEREEEETKLRTVTHTRPALIRLLQLSRARSGLTLEQFSASANVDVAEQIGIETDPSYLPTPRTIYKLAQYLKVPVKSLMALAGLVKFEDLTFDDAAVKFAANSESVEGLSTEEYKLLREYVKFLCER